jgi:uncharacterized protein YggE
VKRKIWVVALGLIAVIAIIALSGCAAGHGNVEFPSGLGLNLNNQQQGIWVNGQGEVTITPDIATFSLGISAQAATVADAQSQAAKAMDAVMNALISNGVAAKDIQTQQFSIQQLTKWDPKTNTNTVTGYQVTNIVTAKIRTLDKAGSIIDAVAAAGGDLTRVNGISFSVDDPTVYNNQAREKAIADAKAKAEQMASLSGVKLGKPTYISESTPYPSPTPVFKADSSGAAPSTPISPGEMKITVNVQIVYSILD